VFVLATGLNRTGKSCRLRWVNYLHPDLKRGRMSSDEERLVVDLHTRWGNQWSRIAKAMPGRTDNEIKNYWRTHTRKLHKNSGSGSASASTTTSMSTSPASPATTSTSSSSSSTTDNDNHSHHGHGDQGTPACHEQADQQLLYTTGVGAMDSNLLWNDAIVDAYAWGAATAPSMILPPPSSPVWDYNCSDLLWGIGDDEVEYKKMLAVAGAS